MSNLHQNQQAQMLQEVRTEDAAYTAKSITPVYRIFVKFVTGLGILGGAESKNRIHFCPSGQD